MYAIKVESQDEHFPVIDRSMSTNNVPELIPVMVEICRTEFNMANPVAVCMSKNVYHIFDIENPYVYAKVSVIKDAN